MERELSPEMVKILTQPIVPPALHYVTPRAIMGQYRWNELKKKYRQKANHHCMICQRYVSHTKDDWLELHERYEYDFEKQIQKLAGYVSICHECHMYIHQGLLNIWLTKGNISPQEYQCIIAKGDELLAEFQLQKQMYPSEEIFYSDAWKLDFAGQLYGRIGSTHNS